MLAKADAYRKAEMERRDLLSGKAEADRVISTLTAAADQFIVARERCKTVIAGYHWFADWGRDTMIALPGLTLATGHPEIAKSILAEFAAHVDQGMLPNRFPDAGETPEYNTVDATLWFFEAVRSLLQYTNDFEFVRANLYAVLTDIIDWHVKGTRYQIHVDSDGLLLLRRTGRATDLDGRESRRLGGHATHGQGCRDSSPLVQRASGNGVLWQKSSAIKQIKSSTKRWRHPRARVLTNSFGTSRQAVSTT